MKRILATTALVLGLTACSATQHSDLVAVSKQACATIGPIVKVAAFVPDPRVTSIVGFANAVCAPLAAGMVPATLDANTPAWLGDLGGMLKVLVPVRG